jgi:DNA modification methylase
MLTVIYKNPGELKPYEKNARTHSAAQVDLIARSMTEFGFTNPILLAKDGTIIAGHGRLEAAQKLRLESVPCIVLENLTAAQQRALVLADNRIALDAGWDVEALRLELADLKLDGFDLSLTGFNLEELDGLLGPVDGKDPDAAPPLPAEAKSKPGDLYVMGAHRLIVGDSTDVGVIQRLMDGAMADACWTDPPYNVAYESAAGKIKNDDMDDKAFFDFLLAAFASTWAWMKPGAAIYVAHADTEGLNFRGAFRGAGFKLSGCIIWRKDSLVLGRSDYQWQHEPILCGWKKGSAHRWYGGRKQTTVLELGEHSPFVRLDDGRYQITVGNQTMIVAADAAVEEVVPSVIRVEKPKKSALHPTMKPVELIERMLRHNARPGDLVLDPFGGSGSTLIAADRLGMCARLVELDPCYADVIVQRWEDWSGRKAEIQPAA